jgi:hypothetical protein
MGLLTGQRGAWAGELLGRQRGEKHLNGGKLQLPGRQPGLSSASIGF